MSILRIVSVLNFLLFCLHFYFPGDGVTLEHLPLELRR